MFQIKRLSKSESDFARSETSESKSDFAAHDNVEPGHPKN
jgi:hypothetical protein